VLRRLRRRRAAALADGTDGAGASAYIEVRADHSSGKKRSSSAFAR
jgi:hypothetical protein